MTASAGLPIPAPLGEPIRSLSRIRERSHTPLKSTLTTTTREFAENALATIEALTKENAALKERIVASEAAAEASGKIQAAALSSFAELINAQNATIESLSKRLAVLEGTTSTTSSQVQTLTHRFNTHRHHIENHQSRIGYDFYSQGPC